MERLFLSLTLDLTDNAPEGAGWYLDFISDGGRIGDPIPITEEDAKRLAHSFHNAMHAVPGPQEPPVFQLVDSGNQLIRQALEQQLKHAEQEAAKIAGLRKRLALQAPDQATN